MRISDWSSDVCSSDLVLAERGEPCLQIVRGPDGLLQFLHRIVGGEHALVRGDIGKLLGRGMRKGRAVRKFLGDGKRGLLERLVRSEEHTSELQSLMRISYAVFCLKKKKIQTTTQ